MSDPDIQFDPEEVEQIAQTRSPEELAAEEILQYMPDDFVEAYRSKTAARWDSDLYDWDGWPVADYEMDDDDPGRWSEQSYYSSFETDNGVLFELFMGANSDGDHDVMYSSVAGSVEWKRLKHDFGVAKYYDAMAEYYRWVAAHGEDPLRYLHNIETTRKTNHKWLVGVKKVCSVGKFVAARKILDNPPSPPTIKRLSQLPKKVKDYMNLDARGYTQDPWDQIEPYLTVARPNTLGYTHFATVDFNQEEPVENARAKLMAAAEQAAEQASRDSAEALKREVALGESEFDPEEVENLAHQAAADFQGLGMKKWEEYYGPLWGYMTETPSSITVRILADMAKNGKVHTEVWWLYQGQGEWINLATGYVEVARFNTWFMSAVEEIERGGLDESIAESKADYDAHLEKARQMAMGEAVDPEEVEAVATSVPPRWELKWEDTFHRVLGIYFEGKRIGDYTVEISHRGGEQLRRSLDKLIKRLESAVPYQYGAGWVNFWDWYWHAKNRMEEPNDA